MADSFSNEPIPVDHLPRLFDDAFVPVDPRYRRGRLAVLIGAAIVVFAVGWWAASEVEPAAIPFAVTGAVLLTLALAGLFVVVESRRLAYQLRGHDLSLRRGVIEHDVTTLPFTRVQHVAVSRGPIERALGLATLEVSTAGPDITIPGLRADEATRLRLLVTERAGVTDDDRAYDDFEAHDDSGAHDDSAPPVIAPPPGP